MLNRAVVIARPKQPYLDWATSLDDSGPVPDVKGEQTVYRRGRFESSSIRSFSKASFTAGAPTRRYAQHHDGAKTVGHRWTPRRPHTQPRNQLPS